MRSWAVGQEVVCIQPKQGLKPSGCIPVGTYLVKGEVYRIDAIVDFHLDPDAVYLVVTGAEGICLVCRKAVAWHESGSKPIEKSLPSVLLDLLDPLPEKKVMEEVS